MPTPTTDPTQLSGEDLRAAVRDRYAAAAREAGATIENAALESSATSATCCSTTSCTRVDPITSDLYDQDAANTSGAALSASLGCGNPTALADLRPGETVLDLGSGGGLDVLLSARRVAPGGKAYGLDMTPEMLELARRNQREAGIENAAFLSGTMEDIPLPDASVDVMISNCVINLAADKDAVLAEAFRVLRPGGRFAVSDVVLLRPLPDAARRVMRLWTGCVAGALLDTDYVAKLHAVGFTEASVQVTRRFGRREVVDVAADLRPEDLGAEADAGSLADQLSGAVASAFIRATKPAGVESGACS